MGINAKKKLKTQAKLRSIKQKFVIIFLIVLFWEKIKDYVDIIAKKLDWNGKVNWDTKPERPGEIFLLNSTNKKITSKLGWEPKVSLDEGLDRTIAIWKEKIK